MKGISHKEASWQRMRWWDSITNSMDMNMSRLPETVRTGEPGMLQFMAWQGVGQDLVTEQQQQ